MQQLSNLDVFFLVKELNSELAGSRLANFYGEGNVFRFKLGPKNLLIDFEKGIYLADSFPDAPMTPSSFVMFFRKRLDNARFVAATQLNCDRIIALEFEKQEKFFVVLELFRQGNLLFCDEKMEIQAVLKPADYASRHLKRGYAYQTPPSGKKSVFSLEASDLQSIKGPIVAALSKVVNLSPFYLEESCKRLGLEFDKTSLSKEDARGLVAEIKGFFSELKPFVYYENGIPTCFASFKLEKFGGKVFKEFPLLSSALQEYYTKQVKAVSEKKDHVANQQESALLEFEEKSMEARRKAEWLYENFSLVEKVLEAAKDGNSEEELNSLAEGVFKVEKKHREIVIEV